MPKNNIRNLSDINNYENKDKILTEFYCLYIISKGIIKILQIKGGYIEFINGELKSMS